MKKFAFLSDIFFAFGAAFLPALCFLRFCRFPLPAALFLSATAGIFAAAAVFLFLGRRRKRFLLAGKDEKEKEKLLFHLAFQSEEKVLDTFSAFFASRDEEGNARNAPETVRALMRRGVPVAEAETEEFCPLFSFCPPDADRVAPFLEENAGKKKTLLCGDLTPDAEKLCARFGVHVLKGADVYRLLKKGNALPKDYLSPPPEKKGLKRRAWFAKSNSRRFLFAGVLLLLTSFLTPFPFYYLLFGSALVLTAALVRIFGYR